MALDLTSFASALKAHYTNDRVENMVYQDNPLLAMVPKMEDFGGKNLPIPIIYGNPQGRSASFSSAQANKTSSQLKDFVLTRAKDYSLASIDNETLEASKGNSNAFMEAATTEIDGAIHSAARSLAIALYGTGSGKIGQLSATSGVTTLITLAEPEDVTNFEKGQTLVLSTANGGGSLKTGTLTVTNIDRDLGTVTVTPSMATLTAVGAVNDYIFVQGDYDAKIKGLLAWLPSVAPSPSESFFSVDRSSDASRLAGIRFDGSAMPIEEALVKAASRAAREGAKPDYCFVNYSKYADLENSLGSKVQYIDMKVNAEIAFRGIQINGPRGPIKVVPDQNCPSDRAFMLTMNVWKLYSLGKAPKILDTDGLKMLRDSSADSVEVRVGYYAQLGCRAPGWNVNIKLA
ncbi:MAG: phage major capsid protein [Candidatus Paceibacterota bacterium]